MLFIYFQGSIRQLNFIVVSLQINKIKELTVKYKYFNIHFQSLKFYKTINFYFKEKIIQTLMVPFSLIISTT